MEKIKNQKKKIPKKEVQIDEATGRPYVIDHETGQKISPVGWEMKYGKKRKGGEIVDMDAVIYGLYRNVVL